MSDKLTPEESSAIESLMRAAYKSDLALSNDANMRKLLIKTLREGVKIGKEKRS